MRLSLVLLVALSVAGCDSDDSLLGEFVGTTEIGSQARAVDGEAVYTVLDGPNGPEFVLGLFVGDLYDSDLDAYDYVLFRRPGDRPGAGAYGVDNDPDRAFNATIARVEDADEPLEAEGSVLNGVDGTLAITRVDGYGFLVGSYEFIAEGVRVGPSSGFVEGAARGTFEARYESPSTFRALGL
ncbi:hypothetical protein [Rubrivirga sp.]|uniref:hypothetical protein n=1 Tax=Rubrivirga sp. TaxID=1885344 RepID=UPI003C77AC9D